MSVYKPDNSPYYHAQFECKGHRVHKSTKATTKKEAEQIERQWRAQIEEDVKQARITGNAPITLDIAAGHYWNDVGCHHVNSATTWTDIQRLIGYFGKDKRLDQLTDADVIALVTWRRSHTIKGRKKNKDGSPVKLIAPATVNRSGVVLLKAIFNHAAAMGHHFPKVPKWKKHKLKEPKERVRELDTHEAQALDDAFAGKHERTNKHQRKNHRTDYELWFRFARLTGLRRNETLIRWADVNVFAKRITTIGKQGKEVSTHLTPAVQAILDECKGDHDEYVFTYVCQRPREGQVKGRRYPITPEGAKSIWRRMVKQAKVQNFRFHDIRHDVGTKVLRLTGNLKTVQKVLNHSDIKTTVKYAHVHDDEVAAALVAFQNPPTLPPTNQKKAG